MIIITIAIIAKLLLEAGGYVLSFHNHIHIGFK